MDTVAGDPPPGPMVLMLYGGEGYIVVIDPPLPTGNHRRAFGEKISAWDFAQSLWCEHRLGFSDQTTGNFGRIGGGR
jgi:hypothetical protein